jgi:hypothetical protein
MANTECLEVASADGQVFVRDSKFGDSGAILRFTPGEWRAFLVGVRRGEFDELA